MRMNKSRLAEIVSDQTGMPASLSLQVIDAITASISRALASADAVKISGFGKFQVQTRKSRTGRNPRTGETIPIPAMTVPTFKAGKGLKDRVRT